MVKGSPPFIHRHLPCVPGPWLGWKSLHIFQALGETAWHWSPQWPKEPPEKLVFRPPVSPTPRRNPLPRRPNRACPGCPRSRRGPRKGPGEGTVGWPGCTQLRAACSGEASRALPPGVWAGRSLQREEAGGWPRPCFPDSLSHVCTCNIQVRELGHTGGEGRCP